MSLQYISFNPAGNLFCTVFPVHGWKENGNRSSEASIYSCFCTIYVYAGGDHRQNLYQYQKCI